MKVDRNSIFRFFYKFHIYGGLFATAFLFVVSLSVLNFQHEILPEKETDTINYTKNIVFDSTLKADTLARYIRHELGIKGHTPPWDFREDKKGNFRFKIHRPARQYEVKLNRKSETVNVSEIHFSTGTILRAMHFGSAAELKDVMLKSWALYAQIAAVLAFIAVCTSIYFWFRKSIKRKRQWYLVALTGVVPIIFILYLWLVG